MGKGLTSNQIKLIAILAMTADHLTWILFPGYDTRWFVLLLHLFGRLTAPVMWYFIAEGYFHTRSVRRYGMRLLSLAVISHFAYRFCFGIQGYTSFFNQTGVVWSLFWGLVLLAVSDKKQPKTLHMLLLIGFVCLVTFPCDWSCVAAMAIFFIGSNRGSFRKQMLWLMVWSAVYAAVYVFFLDEAYGLLQLGTCLSIPLLRLYNGERGSCKFIGKLFYWYYPVHLILCGILRLLIA